MIGNVALMIGYIQGRAHMIRDRGDRSSQRARPQSIVFLTLDVQVIFLSPVCTWDSILLRYLSQNHSQRDAPF